MSSTTHQAGDEIDINGTTIILGTRRGRTGIRWNWYAPETDEAGVIYHPTPEAAIDEAHRSLAKRCACGAVAEMVSSTRPVCANCI